MEITLSIGPDGSAHIVRSSGVAGMPQATELTSGVMTAEELDGGSAPAVDPIDDEAFANSEKDGTRRCHQRTGATVAQEPKPRPQSGTHLPEPQCPS